MNDMNELTAAIKDLSSGSGFKWLNCRILLTVLASLWRRIVLSFFLECFDIGTLPLSLQRAVITLIPKKGDLADTRNWRPVSLFGVDYKILSKALTNRLKLHISTIIHANQLYCIPKRTTFDHLFLIRDLISFAR